MKQNITMQTLGQGHTHATKFWQGSGSLSRMGEIRITKRRQADHDFRHHVLKSCQDSAERTAEDEGNLG
jgi:hypothetical protein